MLENVMIWRFFSTKIVHFLSIFFCQITMVLSCFAAKCCKLTNYFDFKELYIFNNRPEMFEFWRQKLCLRLFFGNFSTTVKISSNFLPSTVEFELSSAMLWFSSSWIRRLSVFMFDYCCYSQGHQLSNINHKSRI